MEQTFEDLLKDIDDRISKLSDELSGAWHPEYREVEIFLLSAYYIGALCSDDTIVSIETLKERLSKSDNGFTLLNHFKKEYDHYPRIFELSEILKSYKLSQYKSIENDVNLADWAVGTLSFRGRDYYRMGGEIDICYETALKVLRHCQGDLEISFEGQDILVRTRCVDTIRHIMTLEYVKGRNVCLFTTELFNFIDLFIDILPAYHNFKRFDIDDLSSLTVELSPTHKHDVIIDVESDKKAIHTVVEALAEDGVCVISGQTLDKLEEQDLFDSCRFPIMFDVACDRIVVCQKQKCSDETIRYANAFQMSGNPDYPDNNVTISSLIYAIKAGKNYSSFHGICNYQVLSKTDFIVNALSKGEQILSTESIFRDEYQVKWRWHRIEDVITINNDLGQHCWDTKIPEERIFKSDDIPSNNVIFDVDSKFYLEKELYEAEGIATPEDLETVNHYELKENNSWENRKDLVVMISGKTQDEINQYNEIFGDAIQSSGKSDIIDYLTYRFITEPMFVMTTAHSPKIARIDASEQFPVLIEQNKIYKVKPWEDDMMPLGDPAGIRLLTFFRVNKEYDENCIAYLLETGRIRNGYILIPSTKEEQNSYFIESRYSQSYLPAVQKVIEGEARQTARSSHIQSLGFSNYRRFENLVPLTLGGISILVGANNAGKSTFVRGLALSLANLKNLVLLDDGKLGFNLSPDKGKDVLSGEFYRIITSTVNNDLNPDKTISFVLSLGDYNFEITIAGGPGSVVPVKSLIVYDLKRGHKLSYSFKNQYLEVTSDFNFSGETISRKFRLIDLKLEAGTHHIINILIRKTYEEANKLINSYDEKVAKLEKKYGYFSKEFIPSLSQFAKQKEVWSVLDGKLGFLKLMADEIETTINACNIDYIHSHSVAQKILMRIDDRNDYMSQIVVDYAQSRILRKSEEHNFVIEWMKRFEIGTDFEISEHFGGEAYSLKVIDMEGMSRYLADMGVGNNQLMVLLLRLATILRNNHIKGDYRKTSTILIEEPEQNLHPKTQSLLGSLFMDIYERGICTIVETHSEYLIRRSQVYVAEKNADKACEKEKWVNPFKVFYFPEKGVPYDMEYLDNGRFKNKFGEGFFDVSSGYNIQLNKIERTTKDKE